MPAVAERGVERRPREGAVLGGLQADRAQVILVQVLGDWRRAVAGVVRVRGAAAAVEAPASRQPGLHVPLLPCPAFLEAATSQWGRVRARHNVERGPALGPLLGDGL